MIKLSRSMAVFARYDAGVEPAACDVGFIGRCLQCIQPRSDVGVVRQRLLDRFGQACGGLGACSRGETRHSQCREGALHLVLRHGIALGNGQSRVIGLGSSNYSCRDEGVRMCS